jgi:hypothetical protein
LLPREGQPPLFAQLYIYDSEASPQIAINRRLDFIYHRKGNAQSNGAGNVLKGKGPTNNGTNNNHRHNNNNNNNNNSRTTVSESNKNLDREIITTLQAFLDENNEYAQRYRTAAARLLDTNAPVLGMDIVSQREGDSRVYNKPTVSEVAGILPGDGLNAPEEREVIVQHQGGQLQRISILDKSYMPLAYPLLFLRGEDGFSLGLTLRQKPPAAKPVQYAPVVNNQTERNVHPAQHEHEGGENDSEEDDLDADELEDDVMVVETLDNEEGDKLGDAVVPSVLSINPQDNQMHQAVPIEDNHEDDGDLDDQDEYHDADDDENNDGLGEPGTRKKKRFRLTMMEYYSYRLQYRLHDFSRWMLSSGRLFQQFVVDMYCTTDMNRLNYIIQNQKTFRVELYSGENQDNGKEASVFFFPRNCTLIHHTSFYLSLQVYKTPPMQVMHSRRTLADALSFPQATLADLAICINSIKMQ